MRSGYPIALARSRAVVITVRNGIVSLRSAPLLTAVLVVASLATWAPARGEGACVDWPLPRETEVRAETVNARAEASIDACADAAVDPSTGGASGGAGSRTIVIVIEDVPILCDVVIVINTSRVAVGGGGVDGTSSTLAGYESTLTGATFVVQEISQRSPWPALP